MTLMFAACSGDDVADAAPDAMADADSIDDVRVMDFGSEDAAPEDMRMEDNRIEDMTVEDMIIPDAPSSPLVYRPAPGTTWQWQLDTGDIDISFNVEMYDVDLFETPQSKIDDLHGRGRKVICYFSAGSYEEFRADKDDFPNAALGNPLDGWPGERWLDIRNNGVRDVMKARMDLALSKQCDGVEPDNVDGYTNNPGFPLTAADQLDYNRFLAEEAHLRGLSVGLKNDLEQVPQLVAWFDWALNEECYEYNECASLQPFLDANKAVFHAEYVPASRAQEVCAGVPNGFSTLIKNLELDAYRLACEDL